MTLSNPEPGSSFYWGAATAAYQIEGSPTADGSGQCIWHEFSHTPGTTFEGQTGDLACDHYHRFAEDIESHAAPRPRRIPLLHPMASDPARRGWQGESGRARLLRPPA